MAPLPRFQGNSYGPMALKVRRKLRPRLALVHGWLFPGAGRFLRHHLKVVRTEFQEQPRRYMVGISGREGASRRKEKRGYTTVAPLLSRSGPQNRNEGTFAKPQFYNTALLFPLEVFKAIGQGVHMFRDVLGHFFRVPQRRLAEGVRSHFSCLVTFWSLFLMLLSLFSSLFSNLLLPNSFCGRVTFGFIVPFFVLKWKCFGASSFCRGAILTNHGISKRGPHVWGFRLHCLPLSMLLGLICLGLPSSTYRCRPYESHFEPEICICNEFQILIGIQEKICINNELTFPHICL